MKQGPHYLFYVPAEIISHYRYVIICADVMFVNKIPFLVTISRSIKFGTAEMLPNRQAKSLATALKNVIRLYKGRRFNVPFVIMDGEFDSICGDIGDMGVTLNTTSNNEHVGDIEQYIWTVKECCRCIYNTLPFTNMPGRLVVEMVYTSVFWLNSFPNHNGISQQYSPRTIVVGQHIDYNQHCQLEFGTYVQTHEEHDNSMLSRATGAIALRPTGNVQGGYFFMSLTTRLRLN
jgi:hypothetical protein